MRRANCCLPETESAGLRLARASALLRSLSLGRRRSTRACCARALCHGGGCRSVQHKRALHRREASLIRRTAVLRRASVGHTEPAGIRVARACAPLSLAVSQEEAQHASLLRARAVPRWLWSIHVYKTALYRREASLIRRTAAVRRASGGHPEQGRMRVRGAPTTTRESPTTAAPAGCFGCKGLCGVLVWVDPHPRRVGTKIMRVRSASRHKNEKVFSPISLWRS